MILPETTPMSARPAALTLTAAPTQALPVRYIQEIARLARTAQDRVTHQMVPRQTRLQPHLLGGARGARAGHGTLLESTRDRALFVHHHRRDHQATSPGLSVQLAARGRSRQVRSCIAFTSLSLQSTDNLHTLQEYLMLKWAIILGIVSLISGWLGFGTLSGVTGTIAKVLFFLFVILFVLAMLALFAII